MMAPVPLQLSLLVLGQALALVSPDVEIALVVGVHLGVLLISEPRVLCVPVVDIAHAGVGNIVRVWGSTLLLFWVNYSKELTEAPGYVLGGDRNPAAPRLRAGGLVRSTVPLVNIVNTAVVLAHTAT